MAERGDRRVYRTRRSRTGVSIGCGSTGPQPAPRRRNERSLNEAISNLNLIEVPLNGKRFTWTNKQFPPLLERLDWFFTSLWSLKPRITAPVSSASQPAFLKGASSDLRTSDFQKVVQESWVNSVDVHDKAKLVTAKFKRLRQDLKSWKKSLPNLSEAILNTKQTLSLLEIVEEFRDLSLEEWNFRAILSEHLVQLLEQQRIYWKQRDTIKWVKLGDANTKIFHTNSSIKNRRNLISSLKLPNGDSVSSHDDKADLLWRSFKERLGTSEFTFLKFDLDQFLQSSVDLSFLQEPFSKQKIDL
ncbi:hypothetical protein U9M48_042112, partial [Paspalum notatum var. saurae]